MKFNTVMTYQPYGCKNICSVAFLNTFPTAGCEAISNWKYKRALIIFDTNISKLTVKKIKQLFQKKNAVVNATSFIYGRKSLDKIIPIWEAMVDFVPDVIVGIGGGTVSDLVGFAASTYQRGIPHILFPTTVLGMIDASIGGKTAIDFHGVKNCIGAIHYPEFVINITELLKSLPQEEFFSGFSEAVKAAVLFDRDFFLLLDQYATKKDFLYTNPYLFQIMKKSASLKMQNSEVPTQHKIKLLYGHAVGHALETLANGRLRHGDAISIGITIEGAIACILKIWDKKEWEKQTRLLEKLHLPILVPKKYNSQVITEKMKLYKKLVTQDAFAFVFPQKIGQVATTCQDNFLTYVKQDEFLKLFNQALLFIHKNS